MAVEPLIVRLSKNCKLRALVRRVLLIISCLRIDLFTASCRWSRTSRCK